ncbi:hypothetical protein KCU78_g4255, partial [Aureobasidium melanogenum]
MSTPWSNEVSVIDQLTTLASLGQVRNVFRSKSSHADARKDDFEGPIEENEFQPVKTLEEQLGDHEDLAEPESQYKNYEDEESEDNENDDYLEHELMMPVDENHEELYDPITGEVTVIARQGKRLTDSEIVEAVQSSEGHARVSAHFDRTLLGIRLYYLRNARDAYETPDDKLNKEDDCIEIEDDSDTNASYAIILGHEEMDFDEIEEQIPKVQSYSGVDYYSYGGPYLSRFNGESVWVANILKEEAYHKKMAAGEKEKIDDLCLSALRLIEEATVEELRELYRDFGMDETPSNITPAKRSNEEPQEPKEAKRPRRIRPEQVKSLNSEMAK